jgi:hypothetical protein
MFNSLFVNMLGDQMYLSLSSHLHLIYNYYQSWDWLLVEFGFWILDFGFCQPIEFDSVT